VLHVAHSAGHYLAQPLMRWMGDVELVLAAQLDEALAGLRLMSRQTMALVCGAPASVERFRPAAVHCRGAAQSGVCRCV
jgi:hypothetical protein